MSDHHPIDLFLVALIALSEGIWWLFRTVLVPAIVIALVVVGYSPTRAVNAPTAPVTPEREPAPITSQLSETALTTSQLGESEPMIHPLVETADHLKGLTNRELMAMVGTRKKHTKAQLVAALVAC